MPVTDARRLGRVALLGIALLAVAQAADYGTFLAMVAEHGLAAERNPLVVALAHEGLWMLTVAKGAAIVLVASTYVISRLRRPRTAWLTLAVGIVAGAIGALSNVGAL